MRSWLRWIPKRLVEPTLRALHGLEHLWTHWLQVGLRQDVRRKQRVVARLMRSLTLGLFSFEFNQIPVRSAALTYTTILGVIPFVVILSAVAGRFGYIDLIQRFVPYVFESLNLDFPLDPILGLLQKAEAMNFQALGFIGSLGLIVSFFLAMNNIELAVDHIWNLRKPRNAWATVKSYTPFLVLLMVLVGALGSVMVRFVTLVNRVDFPGVLPVLRHGAALLLGTVLLTAFIWLGLFLLLLIVPNTKVKLSAAMVGASVATTLLFALTRLFFFFPHLLYSRNNLVLGSLAFVPAMLVFIYVTWLLILYGSAVAFIYQKLYREQEEMEVSPDDIAFAAMESKVLAVLAAMQQLQGEIDFPLPGTDENGEPRILKEPRSVRVADIASHLHVTAEEVHRAALPLQDLAWIRRRGNRHSETAIYVLKAEPEAMDILALHGLLVRINPKGTALLRNMNMLEEIKHTLGLLYSKSKDHPPLSLQTAKGLTNPR